MVPDEIVEHYKEEKFDHRNNDGNDTNNDTIKSQNDNASRIG